jgi:TolB-like protein/DNA-binding winged helix-turn-helix (wHTH) protein/Tfp pilus assembly protein PilF
MSDRHPRGTRARIGAFELDPRAGELVRDGRRMRLPPKPLAVLLALAEAEGEVVLREDLYRRLWPDKTFFDFDNNLNSAVASLRDALGDSAEQPLYIETLPKRGYRLTVPVTWTPGVADASAGLPTAPPSVADRATPASAAAVPASDPLPPGPLPAREPRPRRGLRRWLPLLAAVSAASLLGVAISLRLSASSNGSAMRLAILPFEDLSEGGREPYFAAGLTEDLIAAVGTGLRPRQLEVIAPTSAARYTGSEVPLERVSRELRVDYVLRGTVRREADRVRITARLLSPADEATVWSASFDERLQGVLALQAEIATRIARSLELRLAPPERRPVPAPAYEALLRGRYLLRSGRADAVGEARAELQRAVELAPDYAPAWVALSRSWILSPMPPARRIPQAREAWRRAFALDPLSADVQLLRSSFAIYHDYDWDTAERALAEAVRLAPASSPIQQARAALFAMRGDHQGAARAMERARSLDPVAATVAADAGWYHYVARRYRAAIAQSGRALALEPDHASAKMYQYLAHRELGDLDGARRAALDFQRMLGGSAGDLEATAAGDPTHGLAAFHAWNLARHEAMAREAYVTPSVLALDYLALGDRERAMTELERAYAERSGWLLPFLNVYPALDPLRSDPRFARLESRLAIPRTSG